MQETYDAIVIGAGPGGTTVASFLAMEGHRVLILEKSKFPRFKVGESLLPFSMDVLKDLKVYDKIASGKYIEKYGAQFFDSKESRQVYFEFGDGLDTDHPMAFEVPRGDFDLDLLDHARSLGAEAVLEQEVIDVDYEQDIVQVHTKNKTYTAKYVIDSSGRTSLTGKEFGDRQKNSQFNHVAVYAHYNNVKREMYKKEGDIIIGVLPQNTWSWFIPFKGHRTSVGVVAPPELYREHDNKDDFIEHMLSSQESLSLALKNSERVGDVQVASNYSHKCKNLIGDRWILVGDSACFLDPVFSSGVHMALKTGQFASQVVSHALKNNLPLDRAGLDYEQKVFKGVERFQALLELFYSDSFFEQMLMAFERPQMRKAFTSLVAGDVWNDENLLFRLGVIGRDETESYSL